MLLLRKLRSIPSVAHLAWPSAYLPASGQTPLIEPASQGLYPAGTTNVEVLEDYESLPSDEAANGVFDRMEGPADDPILYDPHIRYPLIILSHGGGSEAYQSLHLGSHGQSSNKRRDNSGTNQRGETACSPQASEPN